jgi:hypothetical protein
MTRLAKTTLYGSVAVALVLGADRGFASEPGNFNASLSGVTDGLALGAAPPPGLYAGLLNFYAFNAAGNGHDTGTTVDALLYIPSIAWSTGWKFLGGSYTVAVAQPVFNVDAWATGLNDPFSPATHIENIHNTVISQSLSWNLGAGWFTSLGFKLDVPDGSQFIGTAAPDYWTYAPELNIAYLGPNWKLTANMHYDINGASRGFTGFLGSVGLENAANGYVTGNQFNADVALLAKVGKWEFGPVANFYYQTTADKPGGGVTCTELAAISPAVACGLDSAVSLGGFVGYNFGLVDLQVWATDVVWHRDEFAGPAVWTRLSFKLWGEEPRPMVTKAISSNY